MNQTLLNLRAARFLSLVLNGKGHYDPTQPRDRTGKWTATGSEWESTYPIYGPGGTSEYAGFIPVQLKTKSFKMVDKDGKPVIDPITGRQKERMLAVDAKGRPISKKENNVPKVITSPTGQKVPPHAWKAPITPGTTGVMLNPDPNGKLQMAYVDTKGNVKADKYHASHTAAAGADKFAMLDKGRAAGDFDRMVAHNDRVLHSSKIDSVRHETALVVATMDDMGGRLGGSTSKVTTKNGFKYEGKGVYDLQAKDFKEKNGKLYVSYVPDKPQVDKDKSSPTYGKPLKQTVPINNPKLADTIRRKIAYESLPKNAAEHKNPSNPHLVFATTPSAVRKYVAHELSSKKLASQRYKPHNFRHNRATSMAEKIAANHLKVHGRFNSESSYQKWLVSVMATRVTAQIPDTPKQLLDSYISPSVYKGLLAPNATKDLSSKGKQVYGHYYPKGLK
jgi:hypothetical protein